MKKSMQIILGSLAVFSLIYLLTKEDNKVKTHYPEKMIERHESKMTALEKNTINSFSNKVFQSAKNFLEQCNYAGVRVLDNLSEENINFEQKIEIAGGAKHIFKIRDYTFVHTFTTNSVFRDEHGQEARILDCNRITYCSISGDDNPWKAISTGDTNALERIAKKYSERGTFEEATNIISRLAERLNNPKNKLNPPIFGWEFRKGYNLGIATGWYKSASEDQFDASWMSLRHSYAVSPIGNNQAVLVTYHENLPQFEDMPPAKKKPKSIREDLLNHINSRIANNHAD